jgi:tight adherence protein B
MTPGRALRRAGIACAMGVAGVLALGGGLLAAPDPGEPSPPSGTLTILSADVSAAPRVELELSIPAPLTGGQVEASAVEVLENGVTVPIDLERVATDSLEVVLLIDTSGSMQQGGAIVAARSAAVEFLGQLPPTVPVGIVAFADAPSLVSPLTLDRGLLVAALNGLGASGRTALYDGIVFASSLFSGGTTDRQFVVLSDGGDTASNATLEDAAAVTAGIRTSIIELQTDESDAAALTRLAETGGGRVTSAADPSGLSELYREVAFSLVDRYRLGFTTDRSGPATYVVNLTVGEQVFSAVTEVLLPSTPATTTPAASTTSTSGPPAPSTTAPPASTAPPAIPPAGEGAAPPAGSSTGSSGWLLYIGAGAVFVSITSLMLFAWPNDPAFRAGRRQLGVDRAAATSSESSIADRLSTYAEGALERGGRRRGLANTLDVAAVALRPGEFVVATTAIALTAGLVLLALVGPWGLVVGVAVVPIVARIVLTTRAQRRRAEFAEQLPDVLQLLVSGLRAGFALPQALDAVANQAPEPARAEFQRVMFESRVGRDLTDSLRAAAERMGSRDFDWVVAAFDINREVGGELAHVLEGIAATVRERQQLTRQVRTLTAEGRISAYVLTALPIVLFALLLLIDRSYFESMTEAPGPALLAISVLLMVVGWIWMRRLLRPRL